MVVRDWQIFVDNRRSVENFLLVQITSTAKIVFSADDLRPVDDWSEQVGRERLSMVHLKTFRRPTHSDES